MSTSGACHVANLRTKSLPSAIASIPAASATADEPLLSGEVIKHIEEIRARNLELREDSFSKMGGSSVASKAFLQCFATDYVDLGEHAGKSGVTVEFGVSSANHRHRHFCFEARSR